MKLPQAEEGALLFEREPCLPKFILGCWALGGHEFRICPPGSASKVQRQPASQPADPAVS